MSERKIDVLDHGFVRLVDRNGRDSTIRMMRAMQRAQELKPVFLKHLVDQGDKRKAAKRTPVSINTVRGWLRQDESFRAEVESALSLWMGLGGERRCKTCRVVKPVGQFSNRSDRPQQLTTCKACKARLGRESYHRTKYSSFFTHKATRTRLRSRSMGIPCDVDADHLESIWTGVCPVLGLPLDQRTPRCEEDSPELDRIIPTKGYTKGNVVWLSRRANRIKNNVSLGEMKLLVEWLERILGGVS